MSPILPFRITVSESYLRGIFLKKFPGYAVDAHFDATYAFTKEASKVLARGWADRVLYFRFLRSSASRVYALFVISSGFRSQ